MIAPIRRLSWEEMHYRLVSLWDIVMRRVRTNKLIDGFQVLAKLSQEMQSKINHPSFASMPIPATGYDLMRGHIADLMDEARELELDVTAANVEKALAVLDGRAAREHLSAHEARNFHRLIEFAQTAVRDQLSKQTVLVVPLSKAKLYEPGAPLFGADVASKFKKKGRWEVGEAGKCLALGRHTACVFHLMRAIEVTIDAIRVCLQLPTPTKGQHKAWGAALEAIRIEIERRENLGYVRQWNSKADKKFFDEVYMSLVAIKDGCRDDTMHVESTYTESEAEHLFALTKGFMQKVASRLDEDGQPLA
jgi:hypothetical protein